MLFVTNRNILRDQGNCSDVVGDVCNEKGPAEMRMREATRQEDQWGVRV